MLNLLKSIGLWLCRILFSVEYHGIEHVPRSGAVIIAGNHPSYLDPVLVSLPVGRMIRFMAWDALFRIPVLGWFIRTMGAFPVDIRRGKGESAFLEAKRILESGQALGIFPEGQRSERGPMGKLKTGTARLAIETGAPIVPVTIGGASRAWPKHRFLPKPAKIVVRYHAPIRLDQAERETRRADRAFQQEVMQRVAAGINRSLHPALRGADLMERWYRQPPSHLRTYEVAPLVVAIVVTALADVRRRLDESVAGIWMPVICYYFMLALDLAVIRPSRAAKWLRNSLPVWLILVWHRFLASAAGLPAGELNALTAGGVLATFFLFFYEDYYTLQKFVRGLVVVYYPALLLLTGWPEPRGVMTAALLFCALFCWRQRVLYRWLVVVVMIALLAVAWALTGPPAPALAVYALLPVAVMAYLQTFVNAAYDIRRAGEVETATQR
ncbi:MAG TPA: lysophospholipid acyltransferase family protein [Blastocatellia bacterium]|nr:lysophospholipid acyltransferase family protein [Blastocatellia bacterium]